MPASTRKEGGLKGAATVKARAIRTAEESRASVMQWLQDRQATNSTVAARRLGSTDAKMRLLAKRLGIPVPQLHRPHVAANKARAWQRLEWLDVAVKGEWPHDAPFELVDPAGVTRKYQGCIQVFDDAAFARILAAFEPDKLLIGREHWEEEDDTTAMAWGAAIRQDGDFIQVQPRWTETGDQMTAGGQYRFTSGVFYLTPMEGEWEKPVPRMQVVSMPRVTLTNRPNITALRPFCNRTPAAAAGGGIEMTLQDSPARAGANKQCGDDPHANQTNKEPKTMIDKAILAALGLSDDATVEEAVAKITALKGSVETANKAAKTAKEHEADTLLTLNAGKFTPSAHPALKALLVENREAGLAILNGVAAPAAPAAAAQPESAAADKKTVAGVFNKAAATAPANAPETKTPEQMSDDELVTAFNTLPEGRDKQAFYRTNRSRLFKLLA